MGKAFYLLLHIRHEPLPLYDVNILVQSEDETSQPTVVTDLNVQQPGTVFLPSNITDPLRIFLYKKAV